jgi:predicted small lipoprotein YifL
MKKKLTILSIASMLFALAGCKDDVPVSTPEDSGTPTDPRSDVAVYEVRQVLQFDPVNVKGTDIGRKFDFFRTLRLTLWMDGETVTHLEFSNGTIPFYPYAYQIPEGKVECVLDDSVTPAELRVKGTNELVALLEEGQLAINFTLDSKLVSYKYNFGLKLQ